MDIITSNLPIIINRKMFQYINENCLKQGSQKHGQTGSEVDSADFSISCTKKMKWSYRGKIVINNKSN